jgi:serine/threonine protein phosphatase PrpC
MIFLENSQKYSLSLSDGALSLVTGLSGLPYAKRHWESSHKASTQSVWKHRVIAVLEALPILGGCMALIERIAFYIKERFFLSSPPKTPQRIHFGEPRNLDANLAIKKMWKNAKKAIEEHYPKAPQHYASCQSEALPSMQTLMSQTPKTPLAFTCSAAEEQGVRSSMEDAHFFKEIPEGAITGVFDGHGGQEVSDIACDLFQKGFSDALTQTQGNVHQAFEKLIHDIHKHIALRPYLDKIGSTAIVCFIDKQSHRIYTATLGDSEANIYRYINGELKSIPLSCVRDWSSKHDAKRAAVALKQPELATEWPKIPGKHLRFPSPYEGVNVSRAIGDVELTGTEETPGVIHKPKITMNQVKPGDILILACDGLKDYVSEEDIIQNLRDAKDPAQALVKFSIQDKQSQDNVSVVAINISSALQKASLPKRFWDRFLRRSS